MTLDADVPRVAQWIDEDQLEDKTESEHENTLQNGLASLPMGSLRTAQTILESDEEEDEESNSSGSESENEPKHWNPKSKPSLAKRSSKHAPTEISSKRPISRRRLVVNPITSQPRDPRFLPLSGEFSKEKHQKNYGFLTDTHETELTTLRDSLCRAKKLLSSTLKSSRHEQEQVVKKLELAVKRAESAVNQDTLEKVARDALNKAAQEEKEKRKVGKAGWWMKNSEKKELLARARFDRIAKQGGNQAVKKAIAKKQKKIAQKEKKSRPFSSQAGKRMRESDPPSSSKRRKLE